MKFCVALLALLVSACSASAYYPQFAERYYDARAPRYYHPYAPPQPYRYVSPYRPHGYYSSPRRYESNYPTYRYDWSWGGGNRGYLGGRGGGWGGEW